MAANLTKTACDAAAPATGPDGKSRERVIWDGAVKGLGLKVAASGHRSFIVLYRAGRGRDAPLRKVTIGTYGSPWTVETARRHAKGLLGRVAEGADPAGQKAAARAAVRAGEAASGTVAAAVVEWLRKDQLRNRRVAEVRRLMEREVLPLWGPRPLTSIRKRDVLALLDPIVDRGTATTANRVLAHVRRFLNWCASRDLIDTNPAQHVERPAAEVRRDRVLDDAELVEIWHALDDLDDPYRSGVKLLLLTAARREELFGGSRDELRGDALHLPAARAKTNEGRIIPLSPQAMAVVEALPAMGSSRWLLTATGRLPFAAHGHAKARLDAAILTRRRKADPDAQPMPAWRHHDLRRSIATGLQKLGFRLEVIETALGHIGGSRAGIVGLYQRHKFEAEVREALDAWGRHVEALVTGTPAKVLSLRRRRAS